MQFSTDELTVDASCTEVELTLTHTGAIPRSAMGHNWVLTTESDAQAVYQEGMQAGLKNEYVKSDDERIIAHTAVIGGRRRKPPLHSTSKTWMSMATTSSSCSFPRPLRHHARPVPDR